MYENEQIRLHKSILDQAKVYLEDADEFYPFGAVIEKHTDRLKPISIYREEKIPNSSDMFKDLETFLIQAIKDNKYTGAGIGVDVMIKVQNEDSEIDRSAIQISFYFSKETRILYYLYFKERNKYIFVEYEM